jgi:hypothetical protein
MIDKPNNLCHKDRCTYSRLSAPSHATIGAPATMDDVVRSDHFGHGQHKRSRLAFRFIFLLISSLHALRAERRNARLILWAKMSTDKTAKYRTEIQQVSRRFELCFFAGHVWELSCYWVEGDA